MNKNRTVKYKWNTNHGYEKDKLITKKKINTRAQNVADCNDSSDDGGKYITD